MALSNLEKAMGAMLGLELAVPGMTRKAAKLAVSSLARATPVVARGAASLALANPYATGAGLGALALQTDPGQQLLAAAEESGRQHRLRTERFVQDTLALAPIKAKRATSKFNRAVKAGMAAVKQSTSNGKKGAITAPAKALALVSKVVSALKKKKKAPKRGIRRKIYLAARRYI